MRGSNVRRLIDPPKSRRHHDEAVILAPFLLRTGSEMSTRRWAHQKLLGSRPRRVKRGENDIEKVFTVDLLHNRAIFIRIKALT